MAYQRVPETAEIRVFYNVGNREVSNVYHAEKVGGYSQSDIDGLAAEVSFVGATAQLASMSGNDAYVRTEVRGLDQENDLFAVDTTGAAAGALSVYPYPQNVSFCIRQLSNVTGRSARGRIYYCGVIRDAFDNSTDGQDRLSVAYANAYLGYIDGMRTTIDNYGTWDPVIVSRYHNSVKRAEAIVFPWISSDYTTRTVATRRSRLGR